MNYLNKINAVMDTVNVGVPLIKISVKSTSIDLKETSWGANLVVSDLTSLMVNDFASRTLDKVNRRYCLNRESTIDKINSHILQRAIDLYHSCSPNKNPRRTKGYKLFIDVYHNNSSKIEYINSLFEIVEYYYNVTKTETIQSKNNDVHRTNIFQLLTLMERKYGKKSSHG